MLSLNGMLFCLPVYKFKYLKLLLFLRQFFNAKHLFLFVMLVTILVPVQAGQFFTTNLTNKLKIFLYVTCLVTRPEISCKAKGQLISFQLNKENSRSVEPIVMTRDTIYRGLVQHYKMYLRTIDSDLILCLNFFEIIISVTIHCLSSIKEVPGFRPKFYCMFSNSL